MKSVPGLNAWPSTASAASGESLRSTSGTVWKKVPSSPAGASPSRAASAARYAVAFTFPGVPAFRPCMESSA